MRKDIAENKEKIEILLKNGTPRVEICRILDCKYETLTRYLTKWGLEGIKNPGRKGLPHLESRKDVLSLLVANSTIGTSSLRKRLVRQGIKENKCEVCGLSPEWNGLPLTLQLDHIDGNRHDNRIENLRIICPNCHSQTSTWCTGERGKKRWRTSIKGYFVEVAQWVARVVANDDVRVQFSPSTLRGG